MVRSDLELELQPQQQEPLTDAVEADSAFGREAPSPLSRVLRRGLVLASLAGVALMCVVAFAVAGGRRRAMRSSPEVGINLASAWDGRMSGPAGTTAQDGDIEQPWWTRSHGPTRSEASFTSGASGTHKDIPPSLRPVESRTDGNICGDDEEYHAGLCYKQCTLLTSGRYPLRIAAATCCQSEPCTFFSLKTTSLPCSGFDVSGDVEGPGACPHAPGACMQDEDLFMGMCYKKCSLLTNGEYPHRTASCTCCRFSGITCLLPFNFKTDLTFGRGGGDDDRNTATPASVHVPIMEFTEMLDHQSPQFCHEDEERFRGTCVEKCRGEYTFRTGASTCCKANGVDCISNVDGHASNTGPKATQQEQSTSDPCGQDEELFLSLCYKKCKLLTGNQYPFRTGPSSCCKVEGSGCYGLSNVRTSQAFFVGGGSGDGTKPIGVHPPLNQPSKP